MNPGRRRVVIALAGAPILVRAADSPKKRLAILTPANMAWIQENYAPMRAALARRGYPEGGRLELLISVGEEKRGISERAVEVVAWRPDVIIADGTLATDAALKATRTIPIVTNVADPVGSGFAKSLRRPGGTVTGLAQGLPELSTKLVEVLRLLVPRISRAAILHWNRPRFQPLARSLAANFERAARQAKIEPLIAPWLDEPGLIETIKGLRARKVQAAIWIGAYDDIDKVAATEAIAARLPLVSTDEQQVEVGMLAAMNSRHEAPGERMAAIVEQIFAGANPAELPFLFPERFRFILNRRTARSIGITFTPELLLRADRVID